MPKDLTEVSTFTSPVTVPLGTDSRDNAAGDIELLAQALANRTLFNSNAIAALTAAAAKLASSNSFTAVNTFTRGLLVELANDPAEALLRSTKTAHDYTTNPTNGWKLLIEGAIDGTRRVRVFVGANDATGLFAITVNAYWQLDGTYASKWRKDDTGADAFCLMVTSENLYVSRQDTGSNNWSTWPTNQGLVSCNQIAGGAGGVWSDADVNATDEFAYVAAKSRTCNVPLFPFTGNASASPPMLIATAAGDVFIPIHIPIGCNAFNLRIAFEQNGANPSTWQLRAGTANFTSGGVPAFVDVGPAATSDAVAGPDVKGIVISAGDGIDAANKDYWLRWQPGQTGDLMAGLRALGWNDASVIRRW